MTAEILADPQLAAAMKEGTKSVHKAAETSLFMKRLLGGSINKDEYGRYIQSLYFIYKELERLLEENKEDAVIKQIYFPEDLNRVPSIVADLEYYFGKDKVAQVTDASQITPAVQAFIDGLNAAVAKNPALLIAHSYSRYLGDLSGGQIMAKRLKKSLLGLSIDDEDFDKTDGVEFFNFENIESPKEFKALYRARLDGAPVTEELKEAIVEESINSFNLLINLVDEVQSISDAGKLIPTVA